MCLSEPWKNKCCFVSALQLKGDHDCLEEDEVEEICEQLQPTWEKCEAFASHNEVPLPDDEKSKISRGYVLIKRALYSIMEKENECIPKQDIIHALKCISFRDHAEWSQKQPGQCIMCTYCC